MICLNATAEPGADEVTQNVFVEIALMVKVLQTLTH